VTSAARILKALYFFEFGFGLIADCGLQIGESEAQERKSTTPNDRSEIRNPKWGARLLSCFVFMALGFLPIEGQRLL